MAITPDTWGIQNHLDSIPEWLRQWNRWLCWTAVHEGGKVAKVPRSVNDPRVGASTNNPDQWGSFESARKATSSGLVSGIGFVLTNIIEDGGRLVAVDLDRCIEKQVIKPWAQAIVDELEGYWELSPSGNGLRGFFIGDLAGPSFLNRQDGVEIYNGDSARFVTVTGRRLKHGTVDVEIVDAAALNAVYQKYKPSSSSYSNGAAAPMPIVLPDADDVMAAATLALNTKFVDYLNTGTIDDAYKGDNSAILFALCQALYGSGFTEDEIFSLLTASEPALSTGERHWRGKAEQYLWRTVQSAKHKGGFSQHDEFEILHEHFLKGTLNLSRFDREPIPEREWLLQDWIPSGVVTLLYGDGGTGKSLLCLELQTCVALGQSFFGIEVTKGTSLGIYCEDDEFEIARRQANINQKYFTDFKEVEQYATWVSRVGEENILMSFDGKSIGNKTKFYTQIKKVLVENNPKLVVFDTVSDFFAGNENVRSEVTQFITLLGGLAREHNCAVLVCAHPSRSGMGTGEGGSTGWSNRARSRMHFRSDPDRTGVRLLELPKSNYGQRTDDDQGPRLELLWHEGTFRHTGDETVQEFMASDEELQDHLFMDLMRQAQATNLVVSDSVRGNYAPRELMRLATADGRRTSTMKLEQAMTRLLVAGRLEAMDERVNGRDRRRLRLKEGME